MECIGGGVNERATTDIPLPNIPDISTESRSVVEDTQICQLVAKQWTNHQSKNEYAKSSRDNSQSWAYRGDKD